MLKKNSTKLKKENCVRFYLNDNLIEKSISDPQQTLLDFLRIDQNLKTLDHEEPKQKDYNFSKKLH